MSRIGNTPVTLPSGVEVNASSSEVAVKGPKGQLSFPLFPEVAVAVEDGKVVISRTGSGGNKKAAALHGLVRAHVQNMVTGVTEGYEKSLEIHGTGWNVKPKGQGIEMQIGFCSAINIWSVDEHKGIAHFKRTLLDYVETVLHSYRYTKRAVLG